MNERLELSADDVRRLIKEGQDRERIKGKPLDPLHATRVEAAVESESSEPETVEEVPPTPESSESSVETSSVKELITSDLGIAIPSGAQSIIDHRVASLSDDVKRRATLLKSRIDTAQANITALQRQIEASGGSALLDQIKAARERKERMPSMKDLTKRYHDVRDREKIYRKVEAMLARTGGKVPGYWRSTPDDRKLFDQLKQLDPANFDLDDAIKNVKRSLRSGSQFFKDKTAVENGYRDELQKRIDLDERINRLEQEAKGIRDLEARQAPFVEHAREQEEELFSLEGLDGLPADIVLRSCQELLPKLGGVDPAAERVALIQLRALQHAREGFYWKEFKEKYPSEHAQAEKVLKTYPETS